MDIEGLKRRADAGSCVAQTILGISYLYGYDVVVDCKEAFRLLSAAGTSRAVPNLGIMNARGLGVSQNLPDAIPLEAGGHEPLETASNPFSPACNPVKPVAETRPRCGEMQA